MILRRNILVDILTIVIILFFKCVKSTLVYSITNNGLFIHGLLYFL